MNGSRNNRARDIRTMSAAEARERAEACDLYAAKAQADKSVVRLAYWQNAKRAYQLIEIAASGRERGMFAA